MDFHKEREHILHENPNIEAIRDFLSEHFPHRLAQLSPIDIALIADGFSEIDARYGPQSDAPKAYHEGTHTRDGFKDFCVYADILGLSPQEFADGCLALAYHDWEQDEGPGGNEEKSALEVMRRMEQAGYSVERQLHTGNCILVTYVEFNEHGQLISKRLMEAEPDKTMLAVSLADMNGITLRGEATMIEHAYRLAKEEKNFTFEHIHKHASDVAKWLSIQYSYLGTRFDMLEPAVRHHVQDPSEAERVLAHLRSEYGGQSSMALNAAKTIYEGVRDAPTEVTRAIAEWACRARSETMFLDAIAQHATKLAVWRKRDRLHNESSRLQP